MELADRRIAGAAQLPVHAHILAPHAPRSLAACEIEHRLAPTPEVTSFSAPAQGPLEGVAVHIDEAGKPRIHAEEDTSWPAVSLGAWLPALSRRRWHSSRTRSRWRASS